MAKRLFYTRSDRRTILVLALLIVGVSVMVLLLRTGGKAADMMEGQTMAADSVKGKTHIVRRHDDHQLHAATATAALFAFDPNTADSTALLKLGLSKWQVANIYKYRSRGGVFRKPSDFARLYGLTVHDYKRLAPYIRISPDFTTPASALFADEPKEQQPQVVKTHKIGQGEHIDLNVNDTAELKRVPGIGNYFAAKIVQYGKRLGGYVSIDQLDEIEDFPKDSKQYFALQATSPQKLNVNKLSLQQLRRHPYLNYYQARAIVDYRRLNGMIKSIDVLLLSPDFTERDIQRLLPYVEY